MNKKNAGDAIYSSPAREHYAVQQKRNEIRAFCNQSSKRVVKLRAALDDIEAGKLANSAEANRWLQQNLPNYAASTIKNFRSGHTTPFSKQFAHDYADLTDEELRELALRLVDAAADVLAQWQKLTEVRKQIADERLYKRRRFPWRPLSEIKQYHAEQRASLMMVRHALKTR